jgi:hypothetical protein
MTTQQGTPPWTVMAVFDPDGSGGDFAYTIGVAELGAGELHLWARPTDGDDPGWDWKLSQQDMGLLLNRCARQHVAGELGVGDSFSIPFDGGAATGHFEVGDPVPAIKLDAYCAGDATPVMPLRWRLER